MKTVTLCGSMRFEARMREIAWELETVQGWNVLQCIYSPEEAAPSKKELENLTRAHYRKMDLSDGIYVVDIGGYVGQSVRQEIDYARGLGKEVLFHSQMSK